METPIQSIATELLNRAHSSLALAVSLANVHAPKLTTEPLSKCKWMTTAATIRMWAELKGLEKFGATKVHEEPEIPFLVVSFIADISNIYCLILRN